MDDIDRIAQSDYLPTDGKSLLLGRDHAQKLNYCQLI